MYSQFPIDSSSPSLSVADKENHHHHENSNPLISTSSNGIPFLGSTNTNAQRTVQHFASGAHYVIPKTNRLCEVCGDKSTGYHYGVITCEGCKGFFRRSLKKALNYKCKKQSNCEITLQTRTLCQFCRLQKCKDVGMRKDCFRQDKISRSIAQDKIEEAETDINLIIDDIVKAHMDNSSFTEDKMKTMVVKPFDVEITQDFRTDYLNIWKIYAQHVSEDIESFVNFIRNLSRFEVLSGPEKAVLLKKNAFAIYVLRNVRAICAEGLAVSDGSLLSTNLLKIIYGELATEMINFAGKFSMIGCNDGDLAVFIVYILCQPLPMDYQMKSQFKSPLKLLQIHDYYQKVLRQRLTTSHAENGTTMFNSLIALIPELNRLNSIHESAMKGLQKHASVLELPELFVDTFEIRIPKEVQPPSQEEIDIPMDHSNFSPNNALDDVPSTSMPDDFLDNELPNGYATTNTKSEVLDDQYFCNL